MDAARAAAAMGVTWVGHTADAPRARVRDAFDASFGFAPVRLPRSLCARSFIAFGVHAFGVARRMVDVMHQDQPGLEKVEPAFITPNASASYLYDYESHVASFQDEATAQNERDVSSISDLFDWKPSGKQVQESEHRAISQTSSPYQTQCWSSDCCASDRGEMAYSFVFGTYEPPTPRVEHHPTLEAATTAALEAAKEVHLENAHISLLYSQGFPTPRENDPRGSGSYAADHSANVRMFEELNTQIAFLTQQLVTRERVLQAEKDEFMASVSLAASTRTAAVQNELRDAIQSGENSRLEANQLREEMATLKEETNRLREFEDRSRREVDALRAEAQNHKHDMEDINSKLLALRDQMNVARDEALRAESPSTPPATAPPTREASRNTPFCESLESSAKVAELRRHVSELENRLAKSTESIHAAMQDAVEARQLAVLKDEEAKRLTDTAKRLSEGLKRKMGEIDAFRRELEEEKAFSAALADTKNVLEKQIAEMGMHISELTKERNDAGRSARLMAEELLSLRPASIELEVWRLWFETEVRNMIRACQEHGQEAFTRKATQFVNTFKNGEADEWVALVVKNRQRALESHYQTAKHGACEKSSQDTVATFVVRAHQKDVKSPPELLRFQCSDA